MTTNDNTKSSNEINIMGQLFEVAPFNKLYLSVISNFLQDSQNLKTIAELAQFLKEMCFTVVLPDYIIGGKDTNYVIRIPEAEDLKDIVVQIITIKLPDADLSKIA